MTHLFISGHSDSGDSFLPRGVLPWPERTRVWIEARTETPCKLTTVHFAPIGEGAVRYLMVAIEKAQPDIVVLPLGGYVFSIGTVAESVRARFGARAESWFLRGEASFQARTADGRLRRQFNRKARWVTRRTLGTKSLATVAQTTAIYSEILHELAQHESIEVVVVRDARFSAETQAREPQLHARFDRMEAALIPIVEQHHFVLADLEGALAEAPDRRVFHQDDGVHTTDAFHETYFDVLRRALGGVVPGPVSPA